MANISKIITPKPLNEYSGDLTIIPAQMGKTYFKEKAHSGHQSPKLSTHLKFVGLKRTTF
jgi:hypothetical protein